MNIKDLHTQEKPVSAVELFKGTAGTATAIRINRNQKLKEHISKTPALLICVEGRVGFEDENDRDVELFAGDYLLIEPMVKHWITGISNSELLLLK